MMRFGVQWPGWDGITDKDNDKVNNDNKVELIR